MTSCAQPAILVGAHDVDGVKQLVDMLGGQFKVLDGILQRCWVALACHDWCCCAVLWLC